tara:strand:+ start:4752 stop:5696 length:945 start_codon:yes stop_codon:yes gene_type:complete
MSINILHIDDEQDVSIHLDEICGDKQGDVFIRWFETFDDGIDALKKDPHAFNGIILDAKCLLNKEDGVFDEHNVIKTITDIENVFRSESIRLPYCILSGFKERLQRFIDIHSLEAYDKNAQEEAAIDYIIRSQSQVTRFKFTNEFPEIIDMGTDGFLLNHNVSTIIQLFQSERLRSTNGALIKAQISQVRPILERILINMSIFGQYDGFDLVPEDYVERKASKTTGVHNLLGCFLYLNGKEITIKDTDVGDMTLQRTKVMPDFISRQASNIYSISSDIANHANTETGTMNTLSMTFYSLIDILYWYRNFMINNR